MKRTANLARLNDSSDECDEPSTSTAANKQKPKRNTTKWKAMLKKSKFHLECCWKDCTFSNDDVNSFVDHVVTHTKDLCEVQLDEEYFDDYVYKCQWGECTYTMDGATEAKMHISYHGYYKHLTAIGAALLAQDDFPKCKRSSVYKDCVPEEICQTKKLRCGWGDCEEESLNPYRFYCHVKCHANYASKSGSKGIRCEWKLCTFTCSKNSGLLIHMQVHTLEKAIACPNCGFGYANNTKFLDHCVRQVKDKSHQCSTCQKQFSSERLLRDHARHHSKMFQCPFCPHTSPVPSGLSIHIRSLHLAEKHFSCSLCDMKSKTKYALIDHMRVHFSEPSYKCTIGECTFGCRSKDSLKKHKFNVHGVGKIRFYTCHECNKQCYHLSTYKLHLKTKHDVVIDCKLKFTTKADGNYYLDPSCRPKPHSDQLFMAYDHVDKWGNVTSKVFVNAMEKEEQDVRQVLILPSNELDPLAVQDPLAEPDLQTLKAVPISGSFPPMFIMQNDIDNFKAANNGVTSFQIMTEMLKSDAPLENQ